MYAVVLRSTALALVRVAHEITRTCYTRSMPQSITMRTRTVCILIISSLK